MSLRVLFPGYSSLTVAALAVFACSEGANANASGVVQGPTDPLEKCSTPSSTATLSPEAGFVEVEGARLFYAFHPADEHPETAPLVVFSNGTAATSLFAVYGTTPYVLDPSAEPTEPPLENPASYTRFANLLFYDSRGGGFSYLMTAAPPSIGVSDEVAINDAAEFVSTIIEFLDAHDGLRDNAVALVGESYGGIRVSLALDFLGVAADPSRASVVSDIETRVPWMFERVRAHSDGAFPRCSREADRSAALDAQFERQVLVQPGFQRLLNVGAPDVESLMRQDEDFATFFAFIPGTGSPPSSYDVRRTFEDDDRISRHADTQLHDPAGLELLLGVDPRSIVRLGSSNGRGTGFRCNDVQLERDTEAELQSVLGVLEPTDAYWLGSWCGQASVEIQNQAAVAFGRNLRRVRTFVTDDRYDSVVYTEAFPLLLEDLGYQVVVVPPEWTRAGAFEAQGADAEKIRIRFPSYESGHEVTIGAPVEFGEDLAEWLAE
jgi:hypothetical protein